MDSTDEAEGIRRRFNYYMSLFDLSQSQLRTCHSSLLVELQRGLEMHKKDPHTYRPAESSLMMLDTCIDTLPSGKEKGIFYAVDFGGTNVRALRCEMDGDGNVKMKALNHNIRSSPVSVNLAKGILDRRATATMLFDEIADVVRRLAEQEKDTKKQKQFGLGFTFSFAIKQTQVNSARLMSWTKDFETGIETNDPVVGQDVCALLDAALSRKKLGISTTVCLNDTVGCMLTGAYSRNPEMPPCLVSIILGTGVNAAYVQRDAKLYGYQGIVINTELGNFDKDLPRNDIDYEIDFHSPIKGRQHFEKMVSGMYIPELIRLLILRILEHKAPKMAWIPFSLNGETCGQMFNDPSKISEVFMSEWMWKVEDQETLGQLYRIVHSVYQRSAAIGAVAIAAMCKATGYLQPAMGGVSIGVDGTVYLKNPLYQDMIKHYLTVVTDEDTAKLMHCVVAEDGSGLGAAILAGTLVSAKV